ncbi:MAG: carboxypeptidase regulatory-like domain-containing protein [Candidatus Altiarchaeota archaeon]|nr:carboxypeptidase regulatory-like domain-containing protein [Candidatus Altiarchaeota archaeon]
MKKSLLVVFWFFVTLHAVAWSQSSSQVISDTNATINVLNNSLQLLPETLTVYAPPNGASTENFNLIAAYPGNTGLNVTISKQENTTDWVNFNGQNKSDFLLSSGEIMEVNFTVAVPSLTTPGIYLVNITANSSDGQTKQINVTINVTQNVGRFNVDVKDLIGTELSGATVLVWSSGFVLKDSGSADGNGVFVSTWLPVDNYTVEASKSGYGINSENASILGALTTTNVSIVLEPTGAPILDVSPSSISETVYTGVQISRILIVKNTGDLPLVNVTLSSDSGWISFSKTLIQSLAGDEEENVYAYFGAFSSAGTRNGKIIIESLNGGSQNITTIVSVSVAESNGDDSSPSSDPTPPSGGIPAIQKEIRVLAPNEINATRGESKLVNVQIKNTGNVLLQDITLNVGGPFPVNISPASGDILPDQSKNFLLSIDIPWDADFKRHNFLLIADGDGVSKSRALVVGVVSNETLTSKEKFRTLIDEMKLMVDEIWKETLLIGKEGYEVEEIFTVLRNATEKLSTAGSDVALEKLGLVEAAITEIRGLLELATKNLGEIKLLAESRVEWTVFDILLATLPFVFVIIITVVVIVYKRKLDKKDQMHHSFMGTFGFGKHHPEKERRVRKASSGDFATDVDETTGSEEE